MPNAGRGGRRRPIRQSWRIQKRAANGGEDGKRKGIKEKKQKKINKEKIMMTLYYADRFIIKNVEYLMFKV